MVANVLLSDPTSPPPPLPPKGSTGQKSTFSEYGHIAYQITGNQEMQQHGCHMVEIVQINLIFFELTTEN